MNYELDNRLCEWQYVAILNVMQTITEPTPFADLYERGLFYVCETSARMYLRILADRGLIECRRESPKSKKLVYKRRDPVVTKEEFQRCFVEEFWDRFND